MIFVLDDLMILMQSFMLPFIRVGALFLASPVFGARTVPVRVRILLAVVVSMVLQSAVEFTQAIEFFSAEGVLLILQQIAVGIGMGLVLQIIFSSVVMAGHAIATAMGLGFASSVDPQNGVQVTIVGQIYLVLATLFFLSINGHLLLIQILADSFTAFPLEVFTLNADFFWSISQFSAQMFSAGILIALPGIVGVLLVNLGFGVITRAAPQLNIFAMGFPITMLAGFILMIISFPMLMPLLEDSFSLTFNFLIALVN